MHIKIIRKETTDKYTLGEFWIDKQRMCLTLEDPIREMKIKYKTAIPFGLYKVKFRKEGRLHEKYLKNYGDEWHFGMLEIEDVPNFTAILIHIGNTVEDTSGCILVGESFDDEKQKLVNSTRAYEKIYSIIAQALLNDIAVTLEVINDCGQ